MHLLTELACVANLIVVIVYWSILHQIAIEKFKDNQMRVLHMYLVHIFPSIGLLIILATTDI